MQRAFSSLLVYNFQYFFGSEFSASLNLFSSPFKPLQGLRRGEGGVYTQSFTWRFSHGRAKLLSLYWYWII